MAAAPTSSAAPSAFSMFAWDVLALPMRWSR